MNGQTQHRYVAFLDVLGFKDMVENLPHEDLKKIYLNFLVSNAAHSTAQGKFKVIETSAGQQAVSDFSETTLRVFVISDSVIIYSQDDGMKSFIDICSAVGKLLALGVFCGMPMRGGIAHGHVSVFGGSSALGELSVNGLLGLPLVRAYQSEGSFAWSGCVIEETCVTRYSSEVERLRSSTPEIADLDHLNGTLILRYTAPRKGAETEEERWVVNWPKQSKSGIQDELLIQSFGRHGKSVNADAVQAIIKNTLDFTRYVRASGKSA